MKIQQVRAGGDVRWKVFYRDDQRHMRSKTLPTKREAEAFRDQVQTDVRHGVWVDPAAGRERLATYWERWYADAGSRLRASTLALYESRWRLYIASSLGARHLSTIRRGDVQRLRDEMVARGVGPTTVAQVLRLTHTLLASAVSDELIARNAAAGVKPPRLPKTEQRFLKPEEVARLVEEMPDRWQAFVLTAAWGGLRFGELAALRLDRVDFLRRVVRVEEAFSEVSGHQILGPTKTGLRRSVTLPKTVVDALARHVATYPRASDGLIFTNTEGGPVWRLGFTRRVWKPAVARAGLAPLRFHDLRHTSVALAIAAGGHAKAIQARAGHASITTTLDRYGHVMEGLDADLADRLEEMATAARLLPDRLGDGRSGARASR